MNRNSILGIVLNVAFVSVRDLRQKNTQKELTMTPEQIETIAGLIAVIGVVEGLILGVVAVLTVMMIDIKNKIDKREEQRQ